MIKVHIKNCWKIIKDKNELLLLKIIEKALSEEKSNIDMISSSAEQLQIAVEDVEKNLLVVQKVSGETVKTAKKSTKISTSLSNSAYELQKELNNIRLYLSGIEFSFRDSL